MTTEVAVAFSAAAGVAAIAVWLWIWHCYATGFCAECDDFIKRMQE